MIKFKTTIEFRDDTTKVIDCVEYPRSREEYWVLCLSPVCREFIPKEAIKKIRVEDFWENEPIKKS